jgi:hypothetical protein
MNNIAVFETFHEDAITGHREWMGTATAAAAKKHGFKCDLAWPYYTDEKQLCHGWGFQSPAAVTRIGCLSSLDIRRHRQPHN